MSIPLKYMELFPNIGGGGGGLGGAFDTSGISRFECPSHVADSIASEMISPSGISADEDAARAWLRTVVPFPMSNLKYRTRSSPLGCH